MLALEQWAENWPFSAGGGGSDCSNPPWLYGPACPQIANTV